MERVDSHFNNVCSQKERSVFKRRNKVLEKKEPNGKKKKNEGTNNNNGLERFVSKNCNTVDAHQKKVKVSNDVFRQTIERFGIRLEVIEKFVKVREELFEVIFPNEGKKVNYKYKIVSELKKIFEMGQDEHLFKVKVNKVTIEFKKDRERIRKLVYDYYYWRNEAAKEVMKYFGPNNFSLLYELARIANVSHPSEVFDAIHDSFLNVMDKIKVTPYMFYYVKRWVTTQLLRNVEKERNKNLVFFSSLIYEDETRGGEDSVMRNLYHLEDALYRDAENGWEDLESRLDLEGIFDELDNRQSEEDSYLENESESEEEQMFDRMLAGTFVEKLKNFSS